MSERGIIFSAPMVRALRAGRKTQTRRIVKPGTRADVTRSPYGVPGDKLWVRETFAATEIDGVTTVFYRAGFDGDGTDFVHLDGSISRIQVKKWTPAIFMPKWAARTVLTITDVRVERAHDISPEDVVAEGIDPTPHRCDCEVCLRTVAFCPASGGSLILAFAELWAEINGRESWDANPLVWAISFKADVR